MDYTTFTKHLETLNQKKNLRRLHPVGSLKNSFIANDYLGIAEDVELQNQFFETIDKKQSLLGSTGSRLLSGNYTEATLFEKEIASAYHKEKALLFNTGYHANVGILSSLKVIPRLHIVADKLCHASIIDGILLSGKPFSRFTHNDIPHLKQILTKLSTTEVETIVVVVESIYSMDGDFANLQSLVRLKKEFPKVLLYVDEAHALGVRGEGGLGYAQETRTLEDIDFLVGTFGKAFASMGAFFVGASPIRDFILNQARSFIFSTMLPPIVTAWNRFLFAKLPSLSQRRLWLQQLSDFLRFKLQEKGYPSLGRSHIIPVYCPGNAESSRLAKQISETGFEVRAIHTPTVPIGTERIRLSLSAAKSMEDIELLADKIPPYKAITL